MRELLHLATSLNNLATLYYAQNRYNEAEPLFRRSLAIRERKLGARHPNEVTTLKNYAVFLRSTERHDEAATLESRIKAIRAKNTDLRHGRRRPHRSTIDSAARFPVIVSADDKCKRDRE